MRLQIRARGLEVEAVTVRRGGSSSSSNSSRKGKGRQARGSGARGLCRGTPRGGCVNMRVHAFSVFVECVECVGLGVDVR